MRSLSLMMKMGLKRLPHLFDVIPLLFSISVFTNKPHLSTHLQELRNEVVRELMMTITMMLPRLLLHSLRPDARPPRSLTAPMRSRQRIPSHMAARW
jgi:hypothetical protein